MLLIIGPHFFLSVLPTGPKPAQITFSVPLKMSHCKTSILWLWFKFLHSVDEYSIRNPVLVMELSVLNEIVRASPFVTYIDGLGVSPQYVFLSAPSTIVKLSLLKSKYFMLVHSGVDGCGISSFKYVENYLTVSSVRCKSYFQQCSILPAIRTFFKIKVCKL